MVRVIGVGDNTVDKYLHLKKMFPGGNAVNVAALAHRYGHTSSYLGWFGNDQYSDLIIRSLQDVGVDISYCRVIEGPNAHCEISLVDGDRVFGKSNPGVATNRELTENDLEYISQHLLTHTSIYSDIESELPKLNAASSNLSFDFSTDWSREYLEKVLPWVNIAIISYPDHSETETEALINWVHKQGPEIVLITQGKRGATLFNGLRFYKQGIIETEVIDTLGAGDAFAARFLVEYLEKVPIEISLQRAAQSAAETCSYYGAFGYGKDF
jgi:fructoselysine 6-kinase